MKRARTSAFALRLPPPKSSTSSVSLTVVRGRQQVVHSQGIFITIVAGRRRTAYVQFDGEIELADVCKCGIDWLPDFTITRSMGCPLDQHRAQAIREASE